MNKKLLQAAAIAHTNLNIFGAIVAILEGGVIYGGDNAAAKKILIICEKEQQRQLEKYDAARINDTKDIHTHALEVSREVMKIINGPKLLGGDVQMQAKIQCAIIEALSSMEQQAHGAMQKPVQALSSERKSLLREPIVLKDTKGTVIPDLVITLNGVPFEDQEEGLRQFKEACQRPAQQPTAGAAQEPVAWVVFADNGNSRIWFSDKTKADKWAQENGISDRLTPLYAAPQTAPIEHQDEKYIAGYREECAAMMAEAKEMLDDARLQMQMIQEALGVSYEPHQSLFERTMDAIRALQAAPHIPADRITAMCRCDAPVQKEGE